MYPPRESQTQEPYQFESAWRTSKGVLVFYRVLKHGEKRLVQFYSDWRKTWINTMVDYPMENVIPHLIPFTGE
jgi:hypothetical protein